MKKNNRKKALHALKNLVLIIGLSTHLPGCFQQSRKVTSETTGEVEYFAGNGFSNTISNLQHPAGEHYKGVTYVTYQGPLEDPYVAAYNHETGKWSGPYKAGVSTLGKTPGKEIDNHGKPAMIVDDEGYIHLIFGGHGGNSHYGTNTFGNTNSGRQTHVVTMKPQDISKWQVLDNITPFGTYSQFVKMDNGDIYLFYRHGAHRSDWVYQKSTDNGRTFTTKVPILKHLVHTDNSGNRVHDSWYAWFTKGQGDEIIGTYNSHVCREHGHNGERHNAYYMVMDTKDHVWRNVIGEEVSIPVTKDHADKKTLVVDTGDKWTTRGTCRLDPAGNPHVTLNLGENIGQKHSGPKQLMYYRWTGNKWSGGGETGLPPKAMGDMLISSSTNVSLLLGYSDEVTWWHSNNGGKSFAKGESLIRRAGTQFVITSMIRNAHPEARVIAAGNDKSDKSLYRKLYILGDGGPIKRQKVEADQFVN